MALGVNDLPHASVRIVAGLGDLALSVRDLPGPAQGVVGIGGQIDTQVLTGCIGTAQTGLLPGSGIGDGLVIDKVRAGLLFDVQEPAIGVVLVADFVIAGISDIFQET